MDRVRAQREAESDPVFCCAAGKRGKMGKGMPREIKNPSRGRLGHTNCPPPRDADSVPPPSLRAASHFARTGTAPSRARFGTGADGRRGNESPYLQSGRGERQFRPVRVPTNDPGRGRPGHRNPAGGGRATGTRPGAAGPQYNRDPIRSQGARRRAGGPRTDATARFASNPGRGRPGHRIPAGGGRATGSIADTAVA